MSQRDPLFQALATISQRVDELGAWRDADAHPLAELTFDGGAGPVPIRVGDPWPERGLPVTLEARAEAPASWRGAPVEVHLDVGGEALLEVDGAALGGLNPYHRRYPLTDAAAPEAAWALRIEAVPHRTFGTPVAEPRVACAELVRPDPEVRALHDDLAAALDAARHLAGGANRPVAQRLADLLREVLAEVPLPRTPSDAYLARLQGTFGTDATDSASGLRDVWEAWQHDADPLALGEAHRAALAPAREHLRAGLEALRAAHPPVGRLALTGHAHIDLAWLWPLEETRRKARRTFATVLTLMERHPDMRFNQSSAQLYADLERDDPRLFERIREQVRAGRWEPVGGMWVEPDGNLPSGEAWARQLLFGQRYFEDRFGRRATVGWLPDTFGYAGNLPQLMREAGLEAFFTTKLNWNERNRFPHDLYWWEGLDGTRILAHTLDAPEGGYNGRVTAANLAATWDNFRGKRYADVSLFSYGYGDGGGGPSEAMLERAARFRDFPGLPRAEHARVDAFYDEVRDARLPTWRGEQYLELHRGTYTTQGELKRLNRAVEHALVEAEAAATLAREHAGAAYPHDALTEAWTTLLRNQFHDILPGSSVRTVNEEAEAELRGALATAERERERALGALSKGVAAADGEDERLVVWNLTLDDRPLIATLPRPRATSFHLLGPDEQVVPHQEDGDAVVVAHPDLRVPGLGYTTLRVQSGAAAADDGPLEATAGRLANAHLIAELGADGCVTSLRERGSGRELLAAPANELRAYVDVPRFYEAWDIDRAYRAESEALVADAPPELVEAGPVRARVRVRRRCEGATVEQDYVLHAGARRLEVHTRARVHGRRTMIRAELPFALRSHEATFETAFGAVTRPTHANTGWDEARFEVPAHRWADLSEAGQGAALLNDGRYGHSVRGGTLGLTLLRSPVFPDPFADEGEHAFRYALLPHEGDWREGVVAEAHDLNAPLLGVRSDGSGGDGPRQARLLGVEATGPGAAAHGVRLAALKPADDGDGTILRLYEAHGGRGTARLADGRRATRVDLLEAPRGGGGAAERFEFEPFELLSLRLPDA